MKSGMSYRPLGGEDANLTFAWRLDPETCASANDQRRPTLDEHRAWLAARLEPGGPITRLVLLEGAALGMFTVIAGQDDTCSIGYMVAPEYRGQGHGRAVRAMALGFVRERLLEARVLTSKIRRDNVRSLVTALKMGSRPVGYVDGFVLLEAAL